MRKHLVIFSVIAMTIFSFGFMREDKTTVATVGRDKITLEEINEKFASLSPSYQDKVKYLDKMIEERLLFKAATKDGYTKTEDFKSKYLSAKQQILIKLLLEDKINSKINISDYDIIDYYSSNPERYKKIEKRRARHIVVKTENILFGNKYTLVHYAGGTVALHNAFRKINSIVMVC